MLTAIRRSQECRTASEKFTKNKYEFVSWFLLFSQYAKKQFVWIKGLEELFSYDLVMQMLKLPPKETMPDVVDHL